MPKAPPRAMTNRALLVRSLPPETAGSLWAGKRWLTTEMTVHPAVKWEAGGGALRTSRDKVAMLHMEYCGHAMGLHVIGRARTEQSS